MTGSGSASVPKPPSTSTDRLVQGLWTETSRRKLSPVVSPLREPRRELRLRPPPLRPVHLRHQPSKSFPRSIRLPPSPLRAEAAARYPSLARTESSNSRHKRRRRATPPSAPRSTHNSASLSPSHLATLEYAKLARSSYLGAKGRPPILPCRPTSGSATPTEPRRGEENCRESGAATSALGGTRERSPPCRLEEGRAPAQARRAGNCILEARGARLRDSPTERTAFFP